MAYYSIQGISLVQLAEQYGTPLYVYDFDKIREKISVLKKSFPGIALKIKYACKANTNLNVLRLMRAEGVELDVVSPQEMELGLLAGFAPEQITFTPSGVDFSEIAWATDQGGMVNLDNLSVLEKFGQRYGGSRPCMIRIKPHVEAGGNDKIRTAHPESKFGISIHQKAEIQAIIQRYGMRLIGLHQHTGSDIKDAHTFLQAAQLMFDFAMDFPDLEIIDLGGGFKVPYSPQDSHIDVPALGATMAQGFQEFCQRYGRTLQLWIEPGKFLVSEAGTLLAKANVVKNDPVLDFVGINTGLNHLIRPMMYGAYHDIFNAQRPEETQHATYRVVGYICETDTFSFDAQGKENQRELQRVQEGDLIAIANAGAYGFSMASHYNSRPLPAEVAVEAGASRLIRRRESLDDLIRNQVQ